MPKYLITYETPEGPVVVRMTASSSEVVAGKLGTTIGHDAVSGFSVREEVPTPLGGALFSLLFATIASYIVVKVISRRFL